jgi:hypothetical protein
MPYYVKDAEGNYVEAQVFDKKDDGTYAAVGTMVPKHRFDEVNGELQTAKPKVTSLTAELETAVGAKKAAETSLATAQGQIASAAEDVAFARLGIDDDIGARAARLALEGVEGADRIAKVQSWKADPTTAPRIMQPYFATEQAADTTQTTTTDTTDTTTTTTTRAQAEANKGANGNDDTRVNASFTGAQIAAMSDAEYKANRDAIQKDMHDNPA